MEKMNTSAQLANQLSRIESLIPKATKVIPNAVENKDAFKESFKEVLTQTLESPATASVTGSPLEKPTNGIKFSNHAIERMQTRGISYTPERLQKLDEDVKKAAAKGSKDTLVLMDDSALIVSVKNNTVVTVMDKNNMKENVFTNIDSTVMI
jgi:flagellar operon protein